MDETLFVCVQCGERHAVYNYSEKSFDCHGCRFRNKIVPALRTCPSCGFHYREYTWFDPSRCSNCHKSFVD